MVDLFMENLIVVCTQHVGFEEYVRDHPNLYIEYHSKNIVYDLITTSIYNYDSKPEILIEALESIQDIYKNINKRIIVIIEDGASACVENIANAGIPLIIFSIKNTEEDYEIYEEKYNSEKKWSKETFIHYTKIIDTCFRVTNMIAYREENIILKELAGNQINEYYILQTISSIIIKNAKDYRR